VDSRLRCRAYPMIAAATFLSGCSVDAHIGARAAMSKDEPAGQVKQTLEAQAGRNADSVVGHGHLPAKVRATQRCMLAQAKLVVAVAANAVDLASRTLEVHVKADNQPLP